MAGACSKVSSPVCDSEAFLSANDDEMAYSEAMSDTVREVLGPLRRKPVEVLVNKLDDCVVGKFSEVHTDDYAEAMPLRSTSVGRSRCRSFALICVYLASIFQSRCPDTSATCSIE